MPGPAIRAWHLALELARHGEVVLVSTSAADRSHPDMDVRAVTGDDLAALVAWSTVVFAPTSVVRRHPVIAAADVPLCIDMYIPTHLENLEPFGAAGSVEHHQAVAHQVSVINDDLRRGDFFLCASERQRDFWLGSLATLGRVNPDTYAADPNLRSLIDVVAFGIPDGEPSRVGAGVRGAFPGIGPDDPVVIWAGGVYNWFDPLSAVRAVEELRHRIPDLRLVFLGMRNPNPDIPEMRVAVELRSLSDSLGLTGTHVFFNEGWVPYDQRATFLLDADIGLSTHLAHLETRFSFRTRVLDYLWAGLPSVLTGGDTLSEEIDRLGLGVAVPPGDPAAIAAAIAHLLADPPARRAVGDHAAAYRWSVVAAPLVRYATDPWRAADNPWAATRPAPPAAAGVAAGSSPVGGGALGALRPYAGAARRAGGRVARRAAQRLARARRAGEGGPRS